MNTNNFRLIPVTLVLFLALSACQTPRALDLPDHLEGVIPWPLEVLAQSPTYRWENQSDSAWSLLYTGEEFAGKGTEVFAYYASPATIGTDTTSQQPYPGVVLVHGGGGTAFRVWVLEWARRGYAALAMDLAGSRPAPMDEQQHPWGTKSYRLPNGGPGQGNDYKFYNIDQPFTEQWPYHAVANIILGHSLLRSLPEVDAERTAVTGISWGGYLTNMVAGVDHRFRAAAPIYGCGFLNEGSFWSDQGTFDTLGTSRSEKWVRLWDPARYAGNAPMPVLLMNGTNDFAYYAPIWERTAQLPPRALRSMIVRMKHSHKDGAKPPEIAAFFDQHLRDGSPLPEIRSCRIKKDQLVAKVRSENDIMSARLAYTNEDKPNKERRWQTISANINGGKISAAIPPKARLYYLFVTDERGMRVSGPVLSR